MKTINTLPVLSDLETAGECLHLGMPVVVYAMHSPQFKGQSKACKRLNLYYSKVLESELDLCRSVLTQAAAKDFDSCMQSSIWFQQFDFASDFTCEILNDTAVITRHITFILGRYGAKRYELTDTWNLTTGLPEK